MLSHPCLSLVTQVIADQSKIKSLVLYGSYGRKSATVNSDVDLILETEKSFDKRELIQSLEPRLEDVIAIVFVKLRSKIVIYFTSKPKIEITLCVNLKDQATYYKGSNIDKEQIKNSILIDRTGITQQTLEMIVDTHQNVVYDINDLITKFIYEFESSSRMHARSDAYQSYFFYNIALEVSIQLHCLNNGIHEYLFLPKNFSTTVLNTELKNVFFQLSGELLLSEVNKQKRQLLDFFYKAIESQVEKTRYSEIKKMLESIYKRDYFWNYRDVATYNDKLKNEMIYRGSCPTLIQPFEAYKELLVERNIKIIIDLRAPREVEEVPFTKSHLNGIQYIIAAFDPWNQSQEFKEKYAHGSNVEIAYRFFSRSCKKSIYKVVKTIAESEQNILFHCHAGKDRTGIIATILHLVSGSNYEVILNDYLASESDTKKENLQIFLDVVNEHGNIQLYLESCGVNDILFKKLKARITK
ncbi:tyrosine-protein phosphatase [uncultured Kordia sp.]|uniref:tyrosine-protein phosphatase n=1 Tax=uncultured Kordia sp. TaxID=507699 RepID=UPI00262F5432|nr:tyrosine-protein phosphatase [uncultured Kordia sp.]